MLWLHVVILAIVQGLTELLPVSSSAHVIVVAMLFHMNMSTPVNALLLVMLHTGTMFAVIVFFWPQWMRTFFASWNAFWDLVRRVFIACALSGIVFLPVYVLILHVLRRGGQRHAAIEELFHKPSWIAPALAAAGLLILYSGLREARSRSAGGNETVGGEGVKVSWQGVLWMGALQGLAIPFRGFSRSGSTISAGLLTGDQRSRVESFSFALAVAITPLAIVWELHRLLKAQAAAGSHLALGAALAPSLLGMVASFLAGLVALRWLSHWLEQGRWYLFGLYCLAASAGVGILALKGF